MTPMSFALAEMRIKSDLERNPEVREACLRLLSWVLSQPAGATDHLSVNRLWKNAQVLDFEIFTPVITYLTGARLPLLNICYEFIDGDLIEQVDTSEVKEAASTGSFIHPITGYSVPDYESKLFVYFELSPEATVMREVS